MTTLATVIQAGEGRIDNLSLTLEYLTAQTRKPDEVLIVADGSVAFREISAAAQEHDWYHRHFCRIVHVPKWEPGREQARNAGARQVGSDIVHFLDSDIILTPHALEHIEEVWDPGHIVVCPYEWLGPDWRQPDEQLHNDPRWPRFNEEERDWVHDVSAGLSCFGGNLAWDRALFLELGGFWDQIHRGEDGELGLRVAEQDIPIRYCKLARGWHLWHPVDHDSVIAENSRNVPMIDGRHWEILGGSHFEVTEDDGASLAQTCPYCNQQIPCNAYWRHQCPPVS